MGSTKRPARIVIVRHGESLYNAARSDNLYLPDQTALDRVRGIPDHEIPLTPRGRAQAHLTGLALKQQFGTFDVVYDSTYRRTVQTRTLLLGAYTPTAVEGMKIRHDHRLRERDKGYTFHMKTEAADHHFPYLAEYYQTFGQFFARPPGGESQAQVCERCYAFIGRLFEQRAGQRVLIVCHGGIVRALRYNLERWTPADYEKNVEMGSMPNCVVFAYGLDSSGRLKLTHENCVYWHEEQMPDLDRLLPSLAVEEERDGDWSGET